MNDRSQAWSSSLRGASSRAHHPDGWFVLNGTNHLPGLCLLGTARLQATSDHHSPLCTIGIAHKSSALVGCQKFHATARLIILNKYDFLDMYCLFGSRISNICKVTHTAQGHTPHLDMISLIKGSSRMYVSEDTTCLVNQIMMVWWWYLPPG